MRARQRRLALERERGWGELMDKRVPEVVYVSGRGSGERGQKLDLGGGGARRPVEQCVLRAEASGGRRRNAQDAKRVELTRRP